MHTAATPAEPYNDASKAIAHASIANELHHLCVLIPLSAAKAVSKIPPAQIAMACGFLDALLRGCRTTPALPGHQTRMIEVVPSRLSEGRDELAKEQRLLEGVTRQPWLASFSFFLTTRQTLELDL